MYNNKNSKKVHIYFILLSIYNIIYYTFKVLTKQKNGLRYGEVKNT